MKTYIGIDNGLDGGIAVLPGVRDMHDMATTMPTLECGKKRVLNEDAIADLFRGWSLVDGNLIVAIEVAQVMPKQGSVGGFNYGTSYGIVRGICVGLQIPYVLVAPRQWQKELFNGLSKSDTKSMSVVVAKRMFPLVSLKATDRSKKDSDGMSDALLIAAYARRMNF